MYLMLIIYQSKIIFQELPNEKIDHGTCLILELKKIKNRS